LIVETETIGYKPALLNTGKTEVYAPDVRNSARAIVDDLPFSELLFKRIRPFLPETWDTKSGIWYARFSGAKISCDARHELPIVHAKLQAN
jgi:hypothetical protein